MKKSRIFLMIAFLFVVLNLSSIVMGAHVEAASLQNVIKAPKAKSGQWVIAKKGYRYRYSNGKYAKKAWLKIGGEIYYFKSNGYLQTGWKTYKKKRYYFDNMGMLVTGWKTIGTKKYYLWKQYGYAATGKSKIAGKYYYFNSKGVMQTGWKKIGKYYYYFKKSNGSMAVSQKVGKYTVDSKGRRITGTVAPDPGENTKSGNVDYFVGDSRTVGMGMATGTSSKCIAEVGMGYSWYVSTAEPQLKAKLKKKPTATVVLNFGVNDVDNYDKYITKYRALMKAYPKARIYIMSVNPIDSKYNWGWYSYSTMVSKIKQFNQKMKAAFPDNYIDCYTYLTKEKFTTVDGIHYNTSTYEKIYNYILTQV